MKTEEQQAAYVIAQAIAASIELEAMKAANWMREMQGHTIAYGEEDFYALILKYGLSHNQVLTTFGS